MAAVPAELTIEELAAESGMTVRNIRAHRPGPARAARGADARRLLRPNHVAALRLIRELQEDGFNLAAIKRLLSDRERTEERFARFRASLLRPPSKSGADGRRRAAARALGVDGDAADQVLARAERLGAVVAADATGTGFRARRC